MQSRFAQKFGPSRKPLCRLAPALAFGALTAAASILPGWAAPAAPQHSTPRSACADAGDVTLDFVAADINDVLKALALQTHSNVVSATDVKGNITVSLSHVTLEEALNVISKLSGYQYAKVGSTYVVGSAASIATLKGGGDEATQTAVIPFTYSTADDIGNIVRQLVPNVKLTPGKAAGGTGGVFVVTGTQADIDQVRQVVGQAEAALSKNIAESQTVVYNIKYVSAADLQSVLSRLAPNVIVTPGPTQGFALQAPSSADASGVTSTTTSYGAPAVPTGGTTTESMTSSLPTKATTTSLLLSGSVTDIAKAQQLLAQIDSRPLQINYEAKVVEISNDKSNELGLTYDFSGAHSTIGELLQSGETNATTTFTDPFPGHILKGRTWGRTPLNQFVTAQLHALFTSGDAKLLANPNISAIDGQQAATFVGDTVSYISSVTQSPTGQNITTSTVNAGIKLFVTGKVNNDGYITMNVHPEVSLVTLASVGTLGIQVPDVRIREATTTVRVHDGDTLAIGGLINDQDTKDIQKVPLLGDIPFFGALFRNTKKSHTHDEIVIFIKVSIQKDKPGA